MKIFLCGQGHIEVNTMFTSLLIGQSKSQIHRHFDKLMLICWGKKINVHVFVVSLDLYLDVYISLNIILGERCDLSCNLATVS